MKTLIIYSSSHHANTEKIAFAMAEVLGADVLKASNVKKDDLSRYDTIGIGSGIYGGRFNKDLIAFVDGADFSGKNVFVFSTSGFGRSDFNISMTAHLENKKAKIIGSFACKGFDTFFIFKLFGGVAKGHPDADDIKNAQDFARGLRI